MMEHSTLASPVPVLISRNKTSRQIAYTDLVIGATTTNLTSAGNPFTSAHVGNTINITSGTTTGFLDIGAVQSAAAAPASGGGSYTFLA
jgi:hypothetical protein